MYKCPDASGSERFDMLLDIPGTLRLERIHSNDAKSEDWYDQSEYEWVMIVSGSASLRF